MEIQAYQAAANATAAPTVGIVMARLAECRKTIGHMVDQARPALAMSDDIKKHIFYGKKPNRDLPHHDSNPAGDCLRFDPDVDLVHALLGILSEGEELLTPLKTLGLPITMDEQETKEFHQNLKEEMGDLLWYIALAARGLGTTLEEIMETNIRKLNEKSKGRYRNGFTEIAAIERDTAAESVLLAGTTPDCVVEAVVEPEPAEFVPGVKLPKENHQRMVVADPPQRGYLRVERVAPGGYQAQVRTVCEHDAHPQRCEICATGME